MDSMHLSIKSSGITVDKFALRQNVQTESKELLLVTPVAAITWLEGM